MNNPYSEKKRAISQSELNTILADHERFVFYKGGRRAQLAHTQLDGLNLANRALNDVDFSGCTLVGATLYGSNLERASLYCADLRGCNLQSAKLARADLRGASLKGANLSFAILDDADLRAAMMMYVGANDIAIVDRNYLQNGKNPDDPVRIDAGVDFSNCSLKHASLGNAKLDNANFSGALLDGAKFKGAKLENAVFKGAVLTGVDIKDLGVPPEALEGCLMDITPEARKMTDQLKARLDSHQEWVATSGKGGIRAVVDGQDLRPLRDIFASRSLTGLSARGAIAVGVDFSQSQLQAAKFDGADLRGADFSGADIRGASFKAAKLAHAKFDRANLCALQLTNGGSLKPDLSGAEGTTEQFIGAQFDSNLLDLGLRFDV